MTTLAEIEAAVATLQPEEMKQLETFLRGLCTQHEKEPDIAEIARRNGFNPFPRRSHGGPPVTTELVRQICEDEGI